MMNDELAAAFEEIANLLEISGGDAFRVNTYRRLVRVIEALKSDIGDIGTVAPLCGIKGVGKSSLEKVQEFIDHGTISLLEELRASVPEGLPQLLSIPGLGPKTISQIHSNLGVVDVAGLKRVIESGQLESLPRMGRQSVKRIAEGIEFMESSGVRTPRGIASLLAEGIAGDLRSLEGVTQLEIAGSMRRGMETVGDVDLLCAAADGEAVVTAFVDHSWTKRVLASGSTKGSITVESGFAGELQFDLRVVPSESFGAALQYFTGSKEHNVVMRKLAIERGWKLNEWGLFHGDEMLAGSEEGEIYGKLGLPFIPPELREGQAEFSTEANFDSLISARDIRGDLHMHTTASDGHSSIEEMAMAARRCGYEYIAITDHTRSSAIASGLSEEEMAEHIEAIRRADANIKGIKVFASCECDILADGSLDYDDDLLRECDLVVASIHSGMSGRGGKGKLSPTERTLAAIENRYVSIIGHPTGRLLNQRKAMELDMGRIVRAAAANGTALEVSSSWQRLDLKDAHIRQALEAGAVLAINSDAHESNGLGRLEHGIATARRGWARTKDVINAWPVGRLGKWLSCMRR